MFYCLIEARILDVVLFSVTDLRQWYAVLCFHRKSQADIVNATTSLVIGTMVFCALARTKVKIIQNS